MPEGDNLVAGKSFFSADGNFFHAKLFYLCRLLAEIFVGLIAHRRDQLIIVDGIITVVTGVSVVGNVISTEQCYFQAKLLCHSGNHRQDALRQLRTIQRHDDCLKARLAVRLGFFGCANQKQRIGGAAQNLFGHAAQEEPVQP